MFREKIYFDRKNIFFSLFLALAVTTQRLIKFTGDIYQKLYPDTFRSLSYKDLLIFLLSLLCFFLVICLLEFLLKKISLENKTKICINSTQKILLWMAFTFAIAFWGCFYLLMSYPGSVLEDSMSSLEQSMGYMHFSNHHPLAFTLFVMFFVKLGMLIRNEVSFGIFVYSIAQIIVISGIQGYFLFWLKNKNVKNIFIFLVYLFYTHNALLPTYSFTMWKDSLFSAFLFSFLLHLFDIFESKGCILNSRFFRIRCYILLVLVSFFRNNAIYVTLITVFILLLYCRKNSVFGIVCIILISICLFIQNPVYNYFGIQTHSEEKIGIPMQQLGYVLTVDGNVTDVEIIDAMLPVDNWKDSYTPFIVDSIKWNSQYDTQYVDAHMNDIIKVWLCNMPANLCSYIKSYLMATYGFWSLGTQDDYCYCQNEITANLFELEQKDYIKRFTGLDFSFLKTRTGHISSGSLFWIMLLAMFFYLKSAKKHLALSLLPLLLTWGTFMIATPVAFSLRYMLSFVYALPFFIYMLWKSCNF